MKSIFKNLGLQEKYDRDGFVIISLLDDADVIELKQYYISIFGSDVKGLYTSHSHSPGELNMKLHKRIGEMMYEPISHHFTDFDYVVNHFVVKSQVDSREFRLHQDWNVVDESETQAAHIWCPLVDTSEHNGGMFVVKGSHFFFDNLRSGSLGISFIDRNTHINNNLEVLKIKAGDALVYKQALFHGSFPNMSDSPRYVALSCIKNKGSKWVYYQKQADYSTNRMVDEYEMNTETFLGCLHLFEKGISPEGLPVLNSFESSRLDTEKISNQLFEQKLNSIYHEK